MAYIIGCGGPSYCWTGERGPALCPGGPADIANLIKQSQPMNLFAAASRSLLVMKLATLEH